ncbi:hypothetical protein FC64_GL000149 [Ligilactobacillus araffinosus DSM 20653]|uniref:Uncharacterized protein n=2 Tax=Ligilactobacillus araffinosus TaxID=147809 RepID=A0A0R1ZMY1_9LACO|nr:hypothetical protein FC64_GL000149 [Ligilactobacillus araffinosus DSM 20653]
MKEGFQMAEMLTKTLELVKVPSFNPGIIGSSSNYIVRCIKCGHTQEINAAFWKDYVQHPYCKYCDQY